MKADYTYQWDQGKARANFAKHGVVFEAVNDFDWDSALTFDDVRDEYGEERYTSIGYISGRLYVLIWTWRKSDIRVISLRKANNRERKFYDTKIIH